MRLLIVFIIILLLIAGGLFFFIGGSDDEMTNRQENTNVPGDFFGDYEGESPDTTLQDNSDSMSDSMKVPAPGSEGVDEMIVNEGNTPNEEDVPEETPEESVVVIDITGKNFEFSQDEIRVHEGDRVRINFSSTDGFHDWTLDEFGARTDRVNAGESTSVEFVADKTGSFEYYCSVGSHRQLGMVGTFIVE